MGQPKRTAPSSAPPDPAYAELRPHFATGDIVLFGGKSDLCRKIQKLTRSRWSHVAMLVRSEDLDAVLIWEATSATDMADLQTGRIGSGVRLTAFSEWTSRYGEEIAVRRLLVERTPDMQAAFNAFRREMAGRPYEKHRFQLMRSLGAGPLGRNSKEDLSSVFCSELIAAAYQRMGLLRSRPPSNDYTPKDFSADRRQKLKLLRGAVLGPEIFLSR
jgi:hypothetical protein